VIRFLIKGLLRDRTRSLFPFITVVTGVTITALGQSYVQGLTSSIGQSAVFSTGHLKVTTRAYAKEADLAANELAYVGVEGLLADLRAEAPDLIWVPRIRFGGLIDIPDERGETKAQAPAGGLGVDLLSKDSPDRRMLAVERAVVRGRMPARRGEILISDELALHLGVAPGAMATLISSTMYNSMATANFTIAGTIRFGIRAMDRGTILADFTDVQQALDMQDAASEILGLFPDSLYRRSAAAGTAGRLSRRWAGETGEFAPAAVAMHDQPGAAELMGYVEIVASVIVFVFTLVMSVVLWNSGLLGSLRRYGEIGLRLAFGENKGHLYRMMIVESLAIGFAGSVVGTVLALGPAYWLQSRGLDIGWMMENSTLMVTSVLRAQITPTTLVIGFLPGLLATGIGTAMSGIGIYKRQTATLIKELET
jgi:putative ABC transport system permease protein